MPAWPDLPAHWLAPAWLSLAIHSPAVVSSRSSAPSPRARVGLKVRTPVVGARPSKPAAAMAVGPCASQSSGFDDHRSCPAK